MGSNAAAALIIFQLKKSNSLKCLHTAHGVDRSVLFMRQARPDNSAIQNVISMDISLMHTDIRLANFTTNLGIEDANCKFYHEQIPKTANMERHVKNKHEGARRFQK